LQHFGTFIAVTVLDTNPNEERDKKVTNRKDARYANSTGRCVPRLVEDQAAIRPNAIAVETKDCAISYKELNDRASALAGELHRCGVGRDVAVGICIKSSIALVVGALAVLKAGAAYLPLDPSFPPKRLLSILNEAKSPVLLTSEIQNDSSPSGPWKTLQLQEDGRMAGTGTPPMESNSHVSFQDLAYVIYTSGSTGKPKGVEIEHRSLLNLIDWHQRTFCITPQDRASQVAGPGFDAAVWEIWPYLTAGASVHIPEESVRADAGALCDWLVAQQITIGFVPTAIVERMMNLNWPANTKLRAILTGADTLHSSPPASLPFTVVNNYGPTECTVVATSGNVPPEAESKEAPSIGKPITNVRVYILDEQLKPVTAGTPGELYIAGAGVARGYRNRPDLTADRFVADPFVREAGARMYKTGDLARMKPDGQIAFLGRMDDQVKIRGYRIEPDEISTTLNRHPAIAQSAVVARQSSGNEQRLIAYLVAANGAEIARSEIQEFLRTQLPEYMIPAVFVRLGVLPLTTNGKLDREKLPQPAPENTINDAGGETPRSVVEERVATLLSELLEIDHIGNRDNFFHLGGHSLLGAQVITRVREVFDVDLPLRTLFDNPTVEGISAEIERLILAKLEGIDHDEAQAILARELQRTAA
jgi:amino acid adenylation domain-containing protein